MNENNSAGSFDYLAVSLQYLRKKCNVNLIIVLPFPDLFIYNELNKSFFLTKIPFTTFGDWKILCLVGVAGVLNTVFLTFWK